MPIPSSDDSRPDTDSHGSRRISREIAILQQDIRDDFDQKLKELSGLMVKFKSLLANDGRAGSELPAAANDAAHTPADRLDGVDEAIDKKISDVLSDIPILTDRITTGAQAEAGDGSKNTKGLYLVHNNDTAQPAGKDPESKSPASEDPLKPDTTPKNENSNKPAKPVSRFSTEPARFESGLYQLNSQLYRFKLELDQELEYREEPLHIHFQHQSELAKVLQQITEKMQQEKNIGR